MKKLNCIYQPLLPGTESDIIIEGVDTSIEGKTILIAYELMTDLINSIFDGCRHRALAVLITWLKNHIHKNAGTNAIVFFNNDMKHIDGDKN